MLGLRLAGGTEQSERRPLELDGDLADPLGQALARAQVEGHALPAPVVDEDLDRRVGLGLRGRRDLAPPCDSPAPAARPRRPRRTDRAPRTGPPRSGEMGRRARSTLTFSSRTASAPKATGGSIAISVKSCTRWADHVAQGPGLLVVRPAVLHAQRLGGGDLHVVHVAPVPDGLEDAVGEAEHDDVLHRLLGQVVVDAVHLALVEDRVARTR